MNRKYFVYMHTSPNSKKYIGITCQEPKNRWGKGLHYKNNKYFWRAISFYGWDNFSHEILHSDLTKEQAEELEIKLIKELHSNERDFGYNIKCGGNSSGPLPIETRIKMRNSALGKIKSKKHCENLSKSLVGHCVSAETRGKIRNKLLGDNNPRYKKPRAEETKIKISEAQKGQKSHRYGTKLTDEHKEKLLNSIKGKPLTEKHINNLRISKANKVPNVVQFSKDGIVLNTFISAAEASRITSIQRRNICKVCCGERETAGGFRWGYK